MFTSATILIKLRQVVFSVCLLLITGCVRQVDPEMLVLTHSDGALTRLPQITLVRSMVPEYSTMTLDLYGVSRQVEEVSSSRFGDPDEYADLSCLNAGMLESLPKAEIVPTSMFWEQVAVPKEAIELSGLFVAPILHLWQDLQLDFLVIVYHKRVDVETMFIEMIVEGAYSNIYRETAAIVVIKLRNQEVVQASKFTFEGEDSVAHGLIVIPLGYAKISSVDLCDAIAKQAGTAIANAVPSLAPRVLVVAAGNDPYDSVQTVIREWKASVGSGDAGAQFQFYKRSPPGREGLKWLCVAANHGHALAQEELGDLNVPGRKKDWEAAGLVRPNEITAYIWYSLAASNGLKRASYFRDELSKNMTDENAAEAERLVAEWKPNPAECDIDIDGTID